MNIPRGARKRVVMHSSNDGESPTPSKKRQKRRRPRVHINEIMACALDAIISTLSLKDLLILGATTKSIRTICVGNEGYWMRITQQFVASNLGYSEYPRPPTKPWKDWFHYLKDQEPRPFAMIRTPAIWPCGQKRKAIGYHQPMEDSIRESKHRANCNQCKDMPFPSTHKIYVEHIMHITPTLTAFHLEDGIPTLFNFGGGPSLPTTIHAVNTKNGKMHCVDERGSFIACDDPTEENKHSMPKFICFG
jgi:hypothetical protein